MRERVEAKLEALQQEFEKGRAMLQEAERQRAELEAKMLQIDGGIRALRDVLDETELANGQPAGVDARGVDETVARLG